MPSTEQSRASVRLGRRLLVATTALVVAPLMLGGAAYAQSSGAPSVQTAGEGPQSAPVAASPAQTTGQTTSEVVVTGSRIARRDFTSTSPIVTVNSQSFQNTANVSVDSTLNKLPQFVSDQNLMGVQAGDIQPTAIHTPGITTASLRGLGSNRNLVLVDGRRLTPVNGLNVIDLNTIPTSIIDHVETISGGASAVYGADAMSGVVNFILKKNFQGVDFDAQTSETQRGDDHEFHVSALFGTNFADDKGNVTFGVDHYTRSAALEANRDFFKRAWANPTVGTNALFQFAGAQYVPNSSTGGCPGLAAYQTTFGNAPSSAQALGDASGLCALGGAFAAPVYFNQDGSLWSPGSGAPFNYGSWAAVDYKGPVNGSTITQQAVYNTLGWLFSGGAAPGVKTTTLKENTDTNYVLSPMNRWTMYGQAHYDFSDNLSMFVQGNFASTETFTRQLPSTLINGWGALIPYNEATDDPASPTFNPALGHAVPTALAVLLNARTGPFPGASMPNAFGPAFGPATAATNTPWLLNMVPDPNSGWLPPRTTDTRNTNWQITAGFDGKLPYKDWTWELYGSHGETQLYSASNGNVDLQRYRQLIDAPNWGANFHQLGNQGPVIGGGFGAGQASCTSGLYNSVFFNQAPSADCLNSILVNLQSMTEVKQDVVEFDTQGTLAQLPAGELKMSLGADYRSNSLNFVPDTLQSENSFTDQVAGLYPAAAVNARVWTKEGYGELTIPVLRDLPFVKSLSLNPGARYSTYSNSKPGWTYKLEGEWHVNDWVYLRGGYNLAVRAPTVAESYLGLQEVFAAGSAYGDPCSKATNAPYGANPAAHGQTAAGAASALAICQAQMTALGTDVYYAGGASPGAGGTSGGPFGWVNQQGNPNLNPEKAHTWTAGVVLRSPVQSPWLNRTQLSVDWYKIKITGAIGFQNPDVVNQACYSQSVLNPDGTVNSTLLNDAVNSASCLNSSRNTANGNANLTTVNYINLGKIETSGFDVQLNWGVNFDSVGLSSVPGSFNVNILFNYLSHMITNSGAPSAWDIDWAGTQGPSPIFGVDAGSAYRWRLNSTFTYATGPASVSLNWRHLPSARATGSINPSATHASSPNNYLQSTNLTLPVSSYDIFDLSATYNLTRTVTLRAGVENLFDKDPAITGYTTGSAGVFPSIFPSVANTGGLTNEGMYDALGRRFYVGVHARF